MRERNAELAQKAQVRAYVVLLLAVALTVLLLLMPMLSPSGFVTVESYENFDLYSGVTYEFDLSDYFVSASERTYFVSGAVNLDVVIDDGLVRVTPHSGFIGKEKIDVIGTLDSPVEVSFVFKVAEKPEPELPAPVPPEENVSENVSQPNVSDVMPIIELPVEEPEMPVSEEILLENKKLGEKIEDDFNFDVVFSNLSLDNESLMLVFYHNSSFNESVFVEGEVEYELSEDVAAPFENVSLVVELDDGIVPEFVLHVGNSSEKFKFGKKVPKVFLEGKEISKKTKKDKKKDSPYYEIIDRDDDFVDVLITKENASVYIRRVNTTNIKALFNWIENTVLTTEIFAAEPIDMQDATITLPRTDEVTAVVECADFDFNFKDCVGDWIAVDVPFNLTENNVSFTVDHFSGYGGGNIAVIDVYSYPSVGDEWTVRFNTTGTANLTITAVQGTTWTDYADSGYSLKFLDVKCGNQSLSYSWINNSVFIPDYYCNETGFEISKVLDTGDHALEFRFGDDVDYAYNFATLWVRTYDPDPSYGNWDYARDVETDSLKNVISGGYVSISFGNFGYLVKYNENGTKSWDKTWGAALGSFRTILGVATDSLRNVFAAGWDLYSTPYVYKYDENGTLLWNVSGRGYTNTSNITDVFQDVDTDSLRNVIITGQTDRNIYFNGTGDFYTIKYDENATHLWNRTVISPYTDTAHRVTTDSLRNVISVGEIQTVNASNVTSGTNRWYIIKYDENGTQLWNVTYVNGSAQGVETDSNRNIYVSGNAFNITGNITTGYHLVKFDENGTQLWNRTSIGFNAYDVAVNSSDYPTAVGYRIVGSNTAWFYVSYYPNGTEVWNRTINNYYQAYGADYDAADDLLVAGSGPGLTFTTAKYGIRRYAPNQTQPVLSSTFGTNKTSENLTVYPQTYSEDSAITNITNWYRNGSSYAVLNMPFDTNTSSAAAGAIKDYTPYSNNGTLGDGIAGNAPSWTQSGV
ncbi:hypothetical protein KY309_02120, partial [Candidatus Woesearchaeota archaeon]|nr:hypothetical protein [Candidatus Woesearchaeota archaeon]